LVVSGTRRLPLRGLRAAPAGPPPRDLRWNPQRYFPDHPLAEQRGRLIRAEPATRRGRRRRYAELRADLERWRPVIAGAARAADAARLRADAARRANALLRSREWSFVLFPEAQLRDWLAPDSLGNSRRGCY
jgi:hypothetical protein